MNDQDLCKHRLLDLSRQADLKGFVTFSSFLNLNEQNIYHTTTKEFYCQSKLFGGYDNAERQMVAFIPDALSYDWEYPIHCLKITAANRKFADQLTHRDVLGAVLNLGIDRSKIGDIIIKEDATYLLCEDHISPIITEQLSKIKHTIVRVTLEEYSQIPELTPNFDIINDVVASNRIDCIIAKAYHYSRSQAYECLMSDKVFINGKCITNCNQSVHTGDIVSVRGCGRFIFETTDSMSKKGKLRITIKKYL